MAFTMSPASTSSISWSATLQNNWNTSNYQSLVLSTGTTTNGSTIQPSGVHLTVNPPSSGTARVVSGTKTGLSVATFYSWYCYGKTASGTWWMVGSQQMSHTKAPVPTGVSGTANSSSQITVSWNAVSNATLYEVFRGGFSLGTTSNRSYINTGLSANTSYTYTVKARVNSIWSDSSSGTTITTLSNLPTTPSNGVYVVDRIEGGFDLAWGSSSGATSYDLEYKLSISSLWTTLSRTTTSTRLTGLSFGSVYDFRVRGRNSHGTSSYTNISTSTVNPQTPNLSQGSVGSSSIVVNVGSISGNSSRVIVSRHSSTGAVENKITTSGGSVTYTGLLGSTQYRFTARSELDTITNGTTIQSVGFGEIYITTANPSAPPPTPSSSPVADARIEGGFNLSWGSSSGATSYTLRIVRGFDNYTITQNFTNNFGAVTGLNFGVRYNFSVRANNSFGSSAYTGSNHATVNPKTPTISIGSSTATSVSVEVSEMLGNWDFVRIACYRHSDNVYIGLTDVYRTSPSHIGVFPNLVSGTEYRFVARSYFTIDGVELSSVSVGTAIGTASNRPSNWNWTTGASNGNKVQNGNFSMTAQEWNNFTNRIRAFEQFKGRPLTTFTQAISGGSFTATMFNQARFAIGSMNPTGITDRKAGDDILASHLNILKDRLNAIN